MFQRIKAGIAAVLMLLPICAVANDRANLVWQAPGGDFTGGSSFAAQAATNRAAAPKKSFSSKPTRYHTADGLQVETTIITNNWGGQDSFSGGADMMHGNNAPAGFGDNSDASMPLLTQEMMEDDGGEVLAMSKTDRNYENVRDDSRDVMVDGNADASVPLQQGENDMSDTSGNAAVASGADISKSWVVVSGKTLRQVLTEWSSDAGWDLVWNTSREYPVAASAVFEGRFMDVSSALVRNFGRAAPVPYAKFYKGNKVLVISTLEDGDNNGY